ncbi:hypothetical protein [Yinghuangia soli]|uniref:DUF4019 domain-containing protein n=1 Tax=Yinghuangia soli TaxID=2908204 RepID=A0AA41PVN2_9ACTN|nr:hypothetical protein [Yinghuangia soli]MCF2526705.1 hypothetical protein [Yinghuangia soli]
MTAVRLRSTLIAGGVSLLLALAWAFSSGPAKPDDGLGVFVDRYVATLNSGDTERLVALLDSPHAAADGPARMERYGRQKWQRVQATWSNPEFAGLFEVRITAWSAKTGTDVTITEQAVHSGGSWHLLPMATVPGVPGPSGAATTRPVDG